MHAKALPSAFALAALFLTALPAWADQDNAVADAAARALAAKSAGPAVAAPAAPAPAPKVVAPVPAPAPATTATPVVPAADAIVHCFSRDGGVETEIVCPATLRPVSAK